MCPCWVQSMEFQQPVFASCVAGKKKIESFGNDKKLDIQKLAYKNRTQTQRQTLKLHTGCLFLDFRDTL